MTHATGAERQRQYMQRLKRAATEKVTKKDMVDLIANQKAILEEIKLLRQRMDEVFK